MLYKLKNGKDLLIREVKESDAFEIVNISRIIGGQSDNLTFGLNDYYFTEDEERIFIRNMRKLGNCLFIAALVDEKIVGVLSFAASQRKRLMHRGDMGIYILKEFWGLNIGSFLIEYFLSWAENNGKIKKASLEVRTDNERALNLYKKYGFEVEGLIKKALFIDGKYYDTYYMGKEIGR